MGLTDSPRLGTLAYGGSRLTPEAAQYMIDQFGHLVGQFVEANRFGFITGDEAREVISNLANVYGGNATNAGRPACPHGAPCRFCDPVQPYVEPDDEVAIALAEANR